MGDEQAQMTSLAEALRALGFIPARALKVMPKNAATGKDRPSAEGGAAAAGLTDAGARFPWRIPNGVFGERVFQEGPPRGFAPPVLARFRRPWGALWKTPSPKTPFGTLWRWDGVKTERSSCAGRDGIALRRRREHGAAPPAAAAAVVAGIKALGRPGPTTTTDKRQPRFPGPWRIDFARSRRFS